jgi:transposase
MSTPLLPDALWNLIQPLLPPSPRRPKGGGPHFYSAEALLGRRCFRLYIPPRRQRQSRRDALLCSASVVTPRTGQRWSGQNRPTGRGRGRSCFILPTPVDASPFSYANSEGHI